MVQANKQETLKVLEELEPEVPSNFESVYVKVGNILEKIMIHDVIRVQSDGNYCYIFTRDRKFVVKRSLVKLMEFLPKNEFVRIHMRNVVAIRKISKIDLSANILFMDKMELAIGPRFRADLINKLNVI